MIQKKSHSPKKVSAVIPTYNGRRLLQKHLLSVFRSLRAGDELVVVEDTGPDDTVPWMLKRFSMRKETTPFSGIDLYRGKHTIGKKRIDITLVYNQKNQRFGETCNRGVRVAQHNLIFLLNSDVAPHATCLQRLLPHFEDASVFGVGPLEIEHGKKSGRNELWFERGMFIHSRAKRLTSGPTAWVSGGSGLFDKKKWEMIGGFDRLYYPAYWEDIDLSFQARKRGWKVLFEAKAVVDHNHETTNVTVFGKRKMDQMSWRNANKFVWKNGDVWQKIAHLLWKPYWWLARS